MRERRRTARTLAVLTLLLGWCGSASAQNTITAATVTATGGDHGVVVEISASTTPDLTLSSITLSFDGALCAMLENQVIQKRGRTIATPQEGGSACPGTGQVQIVFFDLTGAPVIPAGGGTIAAWQFDVRPDAVGGVFPLTITVTQASNGPIAVPLVATNGQLTIAGGPNPTETPAVSPTHTPTSLMVTATPTEVRFTETPTLTPTPAPTQVPTETLTPTRTSLPTPTSTAVPVMCPGDCDGDGQVSIDELIRGVTIALGTRGSAECSSFDRNTDAVVTIDELIQAVSAALAPCLDLLP